MVIWVFAGGTYHFVGYVMFHHILLLEQKFCDCISKLVKVMKIPVPMIDHLAPFSLPILLYNSEFQSLNLGLWNCEVVRKQIIGQKHQRRIL